MGLSITDTDRGYHKLYLAVTAKTPDLKIGVDDRPHEPSGTPTDVIAKAHEFGNGHVPERSFLRAWVDANGPGIKTSMAFWARKSILDGLPWDAALAGFGRYAVKGIRKRILAGTTPPPNAQSTVRRKGHAKTLVETGQMAAAVTFEIGGAAGKPPSSGGGELGEGLGEAETVVAEAVEGVDAFAETVAGVL